ncbi:MAG TPA: hypothetical protein P5121_38375, partial [Caldilineaceae bacterium]|nr:hypothetical protein [Caldilineaceae bacterium]
MNIMPRIAILQRYWSLLLVLLLFFCLGNKEVNAAPLQEPGEGFCVPRAVGVPGMSGPPDWWTDSPGTPR